MFTIVIGEEEQYEEYGRRLVRYLEGHWKGPVRIYSYTEPEKLFQAKDADCYLLGEQFVTEIQNREELAAFYVQEGIRNREIVISDNEQKGYFCRYHSPSELIHMIYERMPDLCEYGAEEGVVSGIRSSHVTGIFWPVFEVSWKNIVTEIMDSGNLYLGMADMNDRKESGGTMGDLCYFIHLQDEEILLRIDEIAEEFQGMYYVESPEAYFDLLELGEEEYQWFFDQLRKGKVYPEIFVGVGCGVFGKGEILKYFDRLILVDSREDQYRHEFCNHVEKAVAAGVIPFDGVIERRYREEILYESL